MSICGGIAGRRGRNPLGVVIHNDAGSINATAEFYQNWLPSHNLMNGFAHDYVCSDGVVHAEDYENMAWHTANAGGNANYIGIEVCQSMGDEATVRANEQASFKLAADILQRYNLPANSTTVKLHREFVATSCPHRSWELHGQAVEAVRAYYIQEINKYMNSTTSSESNTAPAADTNKTENQEDEENMVCIFQVNGENAQYFFDGKNITKLGHEHEREILERIYALNNPGKKMPVLAESKAWFNRLKAVAQRKVM